MTLFGRITAEAWLTAFIFLVSLGGFVFMSSLVAPPKLLFGRSLSAIEPSLFPKLVLGATAVLSGWLFWQRRAEMIRSHAATVDYQGLTRAVLLFAVMVFYALAMKPLGFLVSSALSMAAISVVAGTRSVPVIVALALTAPVVLYLIATRGLAVSLPELSAIEFAYQRVFDLFAAAPEATGADQ